MPKSNGEHVNPLEKEAFTLPTVYKKASEFAEEFDAHRVKFLERAHKEKFTDPITQEQSVFSSLVGHLVFEYHRSTDIVNEFREQYRRHPTSDNEFLLVNARDRREANAMGLLHVVEVGRGLNLMEEGPVKQFEELRVEAERLRADNEKLRTENAGASAELTSLRENADVLRKELDDAKLEIERLSDLVRLFGGNPNRTNSGDVQGGDPNE